MRWLVLLLSAAIFDQAPKANDRIRPLPPADVRVDDEFWRARLDVKQTFKLPYSFDARYLDVVELMLYNGVFSSVSIEDNRVMYNHPLRLDAKARHTFDLACCAANADMRVEPSALIYAHSESTLYVGLFAASEARLHVGGTRVLVTQRTRYPWDGEFEMRIEPDAPTTFGVAIRIPAWTRGAAVPSERYRFHDTDVAAPTLLVNGQTMRVKIDGGFARFSRQWRRGDVLHLYFPMPIQRVLSDLSVAEDRGRAAIQRGPLVYAFESADRAVSLSSIRLPLDAELSDSYRKNAGGGAVVITGPGVVGTPYYARSNRAIESVWLRH